MNTRVLSMAVLLALTFAFTNAANAQFKIGPHAGFDFDASDLFIGANAVVPLGLAIGEQTLNLNGDASYWVTGEGYDLLVIDANLLYPFDTGSSIAPYAGAGVLLSFWSTSSHSGTDFGLNLKGGAEFGSSNMKPFGELGFYSTDGGYVYAQGGVRFTVGEK